MGPFFLKLGWSWGAGSYCLIDKRPEDRTWGLWWVWLVIFFCWRQETGSDRGHRAEALQGGEERGTWPQSAVLGNSEACCSMPASLPGDVQGRSLGGVSGGRVWIRFKFRES